MWVTDELKTFIASVDADQLDFCKCRTYRYLHKSAVADFKRVHDLVLKAWIENPHDVTCLRLYAMLPRMLLRTVPKVVGSAAGKLIRERCKQFRHGHLQDLWHLSPEEERRLLRHSN